MKNRIAPKHMRWLAVATFAAATSLAQNTRAQAPQAETPEDVVTAARGLRDHGKVKEARARLSASFEARRSAIVGYELAQTMRALGDLNGAYDVLVEVASLTLEGTAEVEAQQRAAALFAEIDPLIPMVFLDRGGLEVSDILVDGTSLPRAEWDDAQPLNPGRHEVVLVLADGTGVQKAFTIKERARARIKFGESEPAVPDDPHDKPPPGPPRVTGSYATPIVIADAVSGTLLALAFANESVPLLIGGVVGSLWGAPTVHFINGRVGRGFASFGLHAAGYVVGIGVGAAVAGEDGLDKTGAALVGFSVAGAGLLLDLLVLKHTIETKPEPAKSGISSPTFGLAPIRGGAAASFQFTF